MVAAEVASKISYAPHQNVNPIPLRRSRAETNSCRVHRIAGVMHREQLDRPDANRRTRGLARGKSNLEKSTYSPGPKPTTATTIKIEPSADGMKTTFDGMTPEGKPFHTEAVGAFDGKDNPVKGALLPNTTVAYKRIDGRTFEAQTKVDGKPTTTARVSVSADGKTLTATISGKNAKGETVNNVIVHDKQ